jgi:Tfp pilus assembly protein PilV
MLIRHLLRLRKDERGTSLIEFGIALPVLGIVLIGIADYSQGYSERFALEAAAQRTVERANVGSTQTDYSFLRDEAAAAASVPVSNVNYDSWLECDGARKAFSDSCEADQQVARYVSIEIWKNFIPSFNWTSSSAIRIAGAATVRIQ